MARFVDHYQVLGVRPQVTTEQVQAVCRALVENSENLSERTLERIHAAYEILSDPIRRRRYDETEYRYINLEVLLRKEGIVSKENPLSRSSSPSLTCIATAKRTRRGRYTLRERVGIYISGIVAAGLLAIPVAFGIRDIMTEEYAKDTATQEQRIESKHTFTEAHYQALVTEAAQEQKIEPCLAQAIYETEYVGPFYVSETGAVGVMELMPREGSYTTTNYRNYQKARKEKGRRYKGKSAEQWAKAYVQDLARMAKPFIDKKDYDGLYATDSRFNPEWNISEGVRELAVAFHHFEAKGHLNHDASLLAMAAYNGGIPTVERGGDHIPTTTQGFVNYAAERWEECKK